MHSRSICFVGILLFVGTVVQAQAPTTPDTSQHRTQTFQLPIPQEGILYFRRGTPGGVRIRSRHGQPPSMYTPRRADLEALTPIITSVLEATFRIRPAPLSTLASTSNYDWEADLARFETRMLDRIDRHTNTLLASTAQRNMLQPDARLPQNSPFNDARQVDTTTVATPPPITYVQRTLLETGLFQGIDVIFETDKSVLLPSSAPLLDDIGRLLASYPALELAVEGHTDSVGSEPYNQTLSEARAAAVRTYVLERFPTVDESRLTVRGFGETRPLASNATPTGRALNRRVVFRVLNAEPIEYRE